MSTITIKLTYLLDARLLIWANPLPIIQR